MRQAQVPPPEQQPAADRLQPQPEAAVPKLVKSDDVPQRTTVSLEGAEAGRGHVLALGEVWAECAEVEPQGQAGEGPVQSESVALAVRSVVQAGEAERLGHCHPTGIDGLCRCVPVLVSVEISCYLNNFE